MSDDVQWTILKILAWTKEYLFSKGVENARLESEWLLSAATGLDRVGLYLQFDRPLNPAELAAYRQMVGRRGRREPLQHILGSQEFCGYDFKVTPDVLVPRHDTELLIYEAVKQAPAAARIVDIGTGSGCIAISLKKLLPESQITATDLSEAALQVARQNASALGVNIEFLQGSLFGPLEGRKFDIIISNPPYIPTAEIESLQPEVSFFEPRSALDGGGDGLDVYRELIPASVVHLNSGGVLLLEVGAGEASDVENIIRDTGKFDNPFKILDNTGIERVTGAKLGVSK